MESPWNLTWDIRGAQLPAKTHVAPSLLWFVRAAVAAGFAPVLAQGVRGEEGGKWGADGGGGSSSPLALGGVAARDESS